MKVNKYISLSFIFGLAGVLASCTQDELASGEANGNNNDSFTISVVDEGFVDATTRTTESGFSTKFTNGDAIGIFAVRSGEIQEGINNHRFYYDDGEWVNDGDNITYLSSEFSKMTFWAYYPYDENVKFDPTSDDPFASYISSWTIGDDLDVNYGKYDLMTSTGAVEGDRLKGNIYFTMHHAMALAVVELPSITYNFTNDGLDPYSAGLAAGSFTLNGEAATPYFSSDLGDYGVYRFLVKPNTDFTIGGDYTTHGQKAMEYSGSGNLSAGTAKLFQIAGETVDDFTLEIGDYLCADGTLAKASDGAPSNAVAVVFFVGNGMPSVMWPDIHDASQDVWLREYPNCTHGMAISLTDGNDGATSQCGFNHYFYEGDSKHDTAWYIDEGWGDIYIKFYIADSSDTGLNIEGYLGYNNTALMYAFTETYWDPVLDENGNITTTAVTYGTSYSQMTIQMWDILEAYRAAVPNFPSGSPWIIPDMREWVELINPNITKLDTSISAVGGDKMGDNIYWSSHERNDQNMWASDGSFYGSTSSSTGKMWRYSLVF